MTQPPDDPLPYRNAAADRPAAGRSIFLVCVGVVGGLVSTGLVGLGVVALLANVIRTDAAWAWPAVALLGLTGVAAIAGLVYAWRRRRVVLVGLLIGVLVACLMWGTCFYTLGH